MNKEKLVFQKANYLIMFAGIGLLILGIIIMSMETAEYGFGPMALTIGPIILIAGFAIQFFAIFYKPKTKNGNPEAIILAIVEGLTEFLPISSTGHMIIASAFMGINEDKFTKLFTVCIQFGAILSVLLLYWKRFFVSIDFYIKLFVAFLPAAIIGFVLGDKIDAMLESVTVVAINLLLGGILLLFIDKIFKDATEEPQVVSYKQSFIIGLFQCIALAPGVSRSAATIIGGMSQKLTRKAAAEFSFFLAVPTMFAATAYKLLKGYKDIQQDDLLILLIGNVVAFIVAVLAIKFFISFLTKYGFKIFGYYRIALGLLLLILIFAGVDLKVD